MDYGLPGLQATMKSLDKKGIRACGAGVDARSAMQPIVVDDNGARVGIISCCEAQFGIARRNSAGVAELGPWVYRAIDELRETADAVIVSVHAAVEDSPWPSPYFRHLYRSYIDAGATIVHGHHSHVPQGYESYKDGVIFYGMGNAAVDPGKWRDYPNGMWSLAADIDVSSVPHRWRTFTLEIRDNPASETIVVEDSTAEEQNSHARYFDLCNLPLGDSDLFEALWQEVALRAFYHYGAKYMGISADRESRQPTPARSAKSMLKRVRPSKSAPPTRSAPPDYSLLYAMIACESHRQMLTTALGVLADELQDERTEETGSLADEMMPWSRGTVPA
jgi:poly-gamma-glutamate synthesis protein (capsule biosynthesis protein)